MPSTYFDSSALVKLVLDEEGSAAMRQYILGQDRAVSCSLVRVELPRAVRMRGANAIEQARRVLEDLDLVRIDDALLDAAAALPVSGLRSLDAIHLAAALTLRSSGLAALVTYDARMARAAGLLGLEVVAPR